MKRFVASLMAVAMASTATPSLAQSDGATAAPKIDKTYLRMTRGPRTLGNMTRRLINQNPDVARSLFDQQPGSLEDARLQAFFNPDGNSLVSTPRLNVNGVVALGAVATQLIELDGVTGSFRPVAASAEQGGGTYRWTLNNLTEEAAARLVPLAYCLLERHSARFGEVLATKQVSAQERDLFNAMSSEISDCIPAGQTRTLQPLILRSAIAIAYYTSSREATRPKEELE